MDEPHARPGSPAERGTRRELHVLQQVLPAVPASTVLARRTTRVACRAWRVPHVADDGVLVVSELVTAVLRATHGARVVLRILMTPRRLRLEVHDPSGRLAPARDDAAVDTLVDVEDGGLLGPAGRVPLDALQRDVLRALTCRSGVEPYGAGSQAWGELPLVDPAQTR